jgi:hypothetical protein
MLNLSFLMKSSFLMTVRFSFSVYLKKKQGIELARLLFHFTLSWGKSSNYSKLRNELNSTFLDRIWSKSAFLLVLLRDNEFYTAAKLGNKFYSVFNLIQKIKILNSQSLYEKHYKILTISSNTQLWRNNSRKTLSSMLNTYSRKKSTMGLAPKESIDY